MFAAIVVTAHAVLKVTDAFLKVLGLNSLRIVFVAAITSVLFEVRRDMTRLARNRAALTMIQWESVIEGCALPRRRSVALRAIRPERAEVCLRLGVTTHAGLRRAFEDIVDVTLGTRDRLMLAFEFEGRQIVIELGVCPIVRCMALRTVRAKLSLMRIVFQVATRTVLRRASEDIVDVALIAAHFEVLAR